jgi:ribosome maturation factor RimP
LKKRGYYLGKHQVYEQKTEELLVPILEKYQYELVDVEFVKEAGSWHLRAYIDKEGGITIDDLTTVNHELSDLLDENDFIEESYILEVSSPGLLRPFKKPKDFIRNIGNDVELKLFSPITWEENGKKYSDKEFVGVLKGYDEDSAVVQIGLDDRDLKLSVKEIALIRKMIEF